MSINTVIGFDGWGTETKDIGGGGSGQDTQLRNVNVVDYDPSQGDVARDLQWYIDHNKESLTSKKYVDEHMPVINNPWSPYYELLRTGSSTFKLGDCGIEYNQVQFLYCITGGQNATRQSGKYYNVSFLTDNHDGSQIGHQPAELTGDTFYNYRNPDTNRNEIWVVMTGGYVRFRYAAYRTMIGDFNWTWRAGDPSATLPDGAVPFAKDGETSPVTTVNGKVGDVVLTAGDINTNTLSSTITAIPDGVITSTAPLDVPGVITADNYDSSSIVGQVTWSVDSFPGWASMGMAIADKDDTDHRVTVAFAPEPGSGTFAQAQVNWVGDLSEFKGKQLVLVIDYAYANFTISVTGKDYLSIVHFYTVPTTQSIQKSLDYLDTAVYNEAVARQDDTAEIRDELNTLHRVHVPDYSANTQVTILQGESYVATADGFAMWTDISDRVSINNSDDLPVNVLYPILAGDVFKNVAPAGDAVITLYTHR